MEALPDWESLQRLTATVSRAAPGYSTSLYASPSEVALWCGAGTAQVLSIDGAVLLLRTELGFQRVYHVARDHGALGEALSQLPTGQYVADLVGRGDALDELRALYSANGFLERTFLKRMYRRRSVAPEHTDDLLIAGQDDVDAVASFIARLLDPLSEQLPDRDELRSAASEERLLIVRDGLAVAGMLMYDIHGQLAHLRFWHVDPVMHGAGIGRRLMGSFLSRCAHAQRIILWVVGDNDRSIAIYRHYGFEVDGLIDRIMVANKDQ